MIKSALSAPSAPFAVELATQVALAASIGLIVSIALAGLVLLLAA